MANPITSVPWGPWDPPALAPKAGEALRAPIHVTLRADRPVAPPPPSLPKPAGPVALPPATFVSQHKWREQRMGAVAVYCSDGRWGDAVDELCHECLKIPAYDRFAVPGGPAWVNEADTRRVGLSRTTHEQLEFLVKAHQLTRVVFITHFGCAFYGHRYHCAAEESLTKQLNDVRAAKQIIRKWFGPIDAEGYLAMQRKGVLSFHRIDG